jgi:hypothetical protein
MTRQIASNIILKILLAMIHLASQGHRALTQCFSSFPTSAVHNTQFCGFLFFWGKLTLSALLLEYLLRNSALKQLLILNDPLFFLEFVCTLPLRSTPLHLVVYRRASCTTYLFFFLLQGTTVPAALSCEYPQ